MSKPSSLNIFKTLSGKMLLFGVVPAGVILTVLVLVTTLKMYDFVLEQKKDALKKLTNSVAAEIEQSNVAAVTAAKVMAMTQQNGMFGRRQDSINFARQVLDQSPEFTGAYFGPRQPGGAAPARAASGPARNRRP